jgi:hypothetical protein
VSDKRGRIWKFLEIPAIESGEANVDGGAQSVQFFSFEKLPTFDQAKALTHDVIGVLISPTLHEGLDQRFLSLR